MDEKNFEWIMPVTSKKEMTIFLKFHLTERHFFGWEHNDALTVDLFQGCNHSAITLSVRMRGTNLAPTLFIPKSVKIRCTEFPDLFDNCSMVRWQSEVWGLCLIHISRFVNTEKHLYSWVIPILSSKFLAIWKSFQRRRFYQAGGTISQPHVVNLHSPL